MFALLQFAALIGFQTSGRDAADRVASDDGTCDPTYVRTVARRSSHISSVGEMKDHCADGNQPGRWDRPYFGVTTTTEESSGEFYVRIALLFPALTMYQSQVLVALSVLLAVV